MIMLWLNIFLDTRVLLFGSVRSAGRPFAIQNLRNDSFVCSFDKIRKMTKHNFQKKKVPSGQEDLECFKK